jgi:glutamate/tyrosine decarboxylase-like PLP-dependent enzyme
MIVRKKDSHDSRPVLASEDRLDQALPLSIDDIVAPVHASGRSGHVLDPADADELLTRLPRKSPEEGSPMEQVLNEVQSVAVTHSRHNAHPGFFGYVCSSGLPTDPLSHALVAAMNQNVTGFSSSPGPASMERTVVSWLAQLAGLPDQADGYFVSGGSLANFTAIVTALHHAAGPELHEKGLAACAGESPLTLYISDQGHFTLERAALTLGIGRENVRKIPTDDQRRFRPDALAQALAEDRNAGRRPFCVAASAGTTSTGAIDPLSELATVCREQKVWFHVDAAYGGGALLSRELVPLLAGIELADSVTIDLHKWFFLTFDASVVLFRDPVASQRAFSVEADYIPRPSENRGEAYTYYHRGLETSRRFRALPAYVALRHYGTARLGRVALHQVQCARYLTRMVEEHPQLEVVSPAVLSIVCFRFNPGDLGSADVDRINAGIQSTLMKRGQFYLSATEFDGRPVLRVCILSHTTGPEHMEELVREVVRLGAEYV